MHSRNGILCILGRLLLTCFRPEAALETHDLAIPMPLSGRPSSRLVFRAICLSPPDVGEPGTRRRMERLFHLNGGKYVAIVFLTRKHSQREGDMTILMRLQLE